MTAYSDADWGADPDKRRSCTGYVVMMSNGAVVKSLVYFIIKSKKKPIKKTIFFFFKLYFDSNRYSNNISAPEITALFLIF